MLIIGLTGGLGTGKTTVASLFSELGARVLDADKIAHRLIGENRTCMKRIITSFGKGILTGGRIDRRKLAGIVFNDAKALKKLENIIHPQVIKEIRAKTSCYGKRKDAGPIVIDVPLLFESGLDKHVDVIIAVKASPAEQIRRSMKNLALTRREVLKRIKAQMPIEEKLLLADIIINNQGPINQTKRQVKKVWQELAVLSRRKGKTPLRDLS